MPPNGVKFDFAGTEKLFNKLTADKAKGLLRRFHGQQLAGETVDQMLEVLSEVFFKKTFQTEQTRFDDFGFRDDIVHSVAVNKKSDACFSALRNLVASFYGSRLDHNTCTELAWRLAAGRKTLEDGINLAKEFGPCEPYWTGMKIVDCQHSKPSKTGKHMLVLTFRVFDGVFAGLKFRQSIPYRFVIAKFARDIGFPVFQKVHKNELVQCHFAALLDTNDRGPRAVEFHTPQSINNYNRALRKERAELCPKGHMWLCHQCSLGYTKCDDFGEESTMHCPRATHSRTFEKKECLRCHRDAMFDPADAASVCVECQGRAAAAHAVASR